MKHPKIDKALESFGVDNFIKECEIVLNNNPKARVVLGLLGGASQGRYSYNATAGKRYPRIALRYERNKGIVGIKKHSGRYFYVAI